MGVGNHLPVVVIVDGALGGLAAAKHANYAGAEHSD